jgi:hypothetical protein
LTHDEVDQKGSQGVGLGVAKGHRSPSSISRLSASARSRMRFPAGLGRSRF